VIAAAVRAEYNAEIYHEYGEYILEKWKSVENESGFELRYVLPFVSEEYAVRLTRYGVGGSYILRILSS